MKKMDFHSRFRQLRESFTLKPRKHQKFTMAVASRQAVTQHSWQKDYLKKFKCDPDVEIIPQRAYLRLTPRRTRIIVAYLLEVTKRPLKFGPIDEKPWRNELLKRLHSRGIRSDKVLEYDLIFWLKGIKLIGEYKNARSAEKRLRSTSRRRDTRSLSYTSEEDGHFGPSSPSTIVPEQMPVDAPVINLSEDEGNDFPENRDAPMFEPENFSQMEYEANRTVGETPPNQNSSNIIFSNVGNQVYIEVPPSDNYSFFRLSSSAFQLC